jgi:dolichyl-diphosphooligosaccharide--protein glycosyltransferase
MNTKYVMTDVEMAVGKFGAMAAWSSIPTIRYMANVYQAQGEQFVPVTIYREPYFKTMVARLQFFDGTETPVDQAVGIAYRGMEVQSGAVVPVMTESPKITTNYTEALEFVANARSQGDNAEVASTSPTISPMPIEALQHYRLVHESENAVTSDGQKYVKTFEHVPGATIKGKASPGTRVLIAVPIYDQPPEGVRLLPVNVTDANGEFTLVVPYSTEGPTPN